MIRNNSFLNGEIHNWYKINFGYSDQLVSILLDYFQVKSTSRILDPFCGTGTTIIECMKWGVEAIGVDANPSSVFAAKVKTNWKINPTILQNNLGKVLEERVKDIYIKSDETYKYLIHSGMVARGWISLKPLLKAISIKINIKNLLTTSDYKNALMLALISEVVYNAANVKFGPELYCGPVKLDSDVHLGFKNRVETMANDLQVAKKILPIHSEIFQDDARSLSCLSLNKKKFDFIITSPPYPSEHDYTRNSRLELAFLEKVTSRETLRQIKKGMIRSHTKGIYTEDDDSSFVSRFSSIKKLENKINKAAKDKTHGFARLYSTVMKEYFGGMRRHLRSVHPHLKKGALCAYIVGDQSSYLRTQISTSKILSQIAKNEGFIEEETIHFRNRWSSSTSKFVRENILVLRRV